MPEDVRPGMRSVTVRHLRPEQAELDIDFVLHSTPEVRMRWAHRANWYSPQELAELNG